MRLSAALSLREMFAGAGRETAYGCVHALRVAAEAYGSHGHRTACCALRGQGRHQPRRIRPLVRRAKRRRGRSPAPPVRDGRVVLPQALA